MEEDTHSSLGDIRNRSPNGLVSQLLEIQTHQVPEPKWLEWARDPLCLCRVSQKSSRKRKHGADGIQVPDASKLLRRIPRSGKHYVAVSYTNDPSEFEGNATGGYCILGSARGNDAAPTNVRDCVLQRAFKFADYYGVEFIWIDDECINRHDQEEHEVAMQSMDLIYNFSEYPVGLLTQPIESHQCLELLRRLLRSDFVKAQGDRDIPVLKSHISAKVALDVVDLLDYITSDKWWTRAWIFQEAYRSSVKMTLLIPHSLGPGKVQVMNEECIIPGELQVNSADFHRQSTLFCLAFRRKAEKEWQGGHVKSEDILKCEEILRRARKYNILYRHGNFAGQKSARKAMSPFIFTDIGSREISVPSDILAIAANCCNYSTRLDTKSLSRTSCSLSMSILALYLLNGEIIMNNKNDESLLSNDIFSHLRQIALDKFDPPVESKELDFIKHCRLVDVRLSQDGIVTSGRLWRLHKAIDTGELTSEWQSERDTLDGLNGYQRSRLRLLSKEVRIQGYDKLADDLDKYLRDDAEKRSTPSKSYQDLMAETVVEAIRSRKMIHLGCLVGPNQSPYRGIFVSESALKTPSHVFTAWSWAGSGGKDLDEIHAERLLDKYVSLEVDVMYLDGDRPQLMTRRWINGLCFFAGESPRDFVFPYPTSLTG